MSFDNGKRNILIVHNYYQIPGGEDSVVSNEKKMLEDEGHKVTFYSRSNSELNEMSILRKIVLPLIAVFNLRTYRDIKKIIKKQQIEIVHVHNTLHLISPSVYYAALSMNVPVIQTVHNFRLLCPGATFYRDGHICEKCVEHGLICALRYRCYRGSLLQTLVCVVSMIFHRMTGIYGRINYICLTEFNKDKLLNLKQIKESKVYVKPNFTYDVIYRKESRDYYLYVGRIEEDKGISLLVDAFSRMPNRKLILAGTGTSIDLYKKKVEQKGILNIEFTGFLEKEKFVRMFRQAKAVIVASQWYEAFGIIIIEAFASHTPVIVGDIGNVSNLVDEEINGLKYQYNSPDSLISVLDHFEQLDLEALGEKAYQKYKEKYSILSNYKNMETIYTDVFRGDKCTAFLFVGRIDKLKGIDILLQAWNQIEYVQGAEALKLIICGTGPMEEWCRKYIKENNLKSVDMLGFVENTKVKEIMSKVAAVILPTQCYEGFPMTVVEAYSVGVPVLGSDLGNTGSLIKDGVTGLRFKHNDVQSIINAVNWIKDNKCGNILNYYMQNYSKERNYKIMMQIYRDISENVD